MNLMVSDDTKYLMARFKEQGVKPLTKKEREELTTQKNIFIEEKSRLENEIHNHHRITNDLENKLKEFLDNNTLLIPRKVYVGWKIIVHDQMKDHSKDPPCYLRAAIFYGSSSEDTQKEYYCLFCESRFFKD